MSLIKCPECGQEISDLAKACIHCGFPLELLNKNTCNTYRVILNPVEKDYEIRKSLSGLLMKFFSCDWITSMRILETTPIVLYHNISKEEALKIHNDMMNITKSSAIEQENHISHIQTVEQLLELIEAQKPKCPHCNSTNIRKIGAGKKLAHGAAFGLFSKTARSQWECRNCGNKW